MFTLNNYTEEDVTKLSILPNDVEYLVFGKEKGESGTPHLQGFVVYKKRISFSKVKLLTGDRAHIEKAKGTKQQAATYCKKDGDFVELGKVPPEQGQRTDLQLVHELLKQGASFTTIADKFPSAAIRYGAGIIRLRQLYPRRERNVPEIAVFWGKTGVGKTRRVWEFTNHDEIWTHPGERWFDGYEGHSTVLFDDFDGSWFKIAYLLKLLDRYRFQVPIKGGYTWWVPTHIFITSNIDPKSWYPNAHQEHVDAMFRRFTTVLHITEPQY